MDKASKDWCPFAMDCMPWRHRTTTFVSAHFWTSLLCNQHHNKQWACSQCLSSSSCVYIPYITNSTHHHHHRHHRHHYHHISSYPENSVTKNQRDSNSIQIASTWMTFSHRSSSPVTKKLSRRLVPTSTCADLIKFQKAKTEKVNFHSSYLYK